MQKENKPCLCPHCGAKMIKHWHRISRGLAISLVDFRKQVLKNSKNKVHVKDELNLSNSAFTNFQKLRYHGLVAKYKDPETKQHVAGYWLLTRRGNLFCKNMLEIPVRVQTFRNKICDKDPNHVHISDVLQNDDMPFWDSKDDMEFEFIDIQEIGEIKYDKDGQMIMNFDED
jgi:hypothetical protein